MKMSTVVSSARTLQKFGSAPIGRMESVNGGAVARSAAMTFSSSSMMIALTSLFFIGSSFRLCGKNFLPPPQDRRNMPLDLVELSCQAIELIEQTLTTRKPGSSHPASGIFLAAVPTPESATGNERHELGLAGVDVVRAALGSTASHSVSHTVAVSVVIGTVGQRLGIDAERLSPARPRIAERVLTAREITALGTSIEWIDILRCFCMKEAAYKALD